MLGYAVAYLKPWKELSRLPRPLFVLAGATLVNRMGTMALPFLVLYLTRHVGFTPSQAGFVLGVYGAVSFGVSPLAGRLCDRIHPVRVMQGSLLLSAMFMALFPLAHTYAQVLGLIAAWALTAEGFRPASLTLRAELSPPEMRKQTQALLRLANNLGMSMGPALGGFIAHWSFPALFRVDALSSALAAVVMFVFFRGKLPKGEAPAIDVGPSVGALRDMRFVNVLFGFVIVMIVFFQHESSLGLFMVRNLGLNETFFGLVFTLNTLLIVALEIPINHYTARWPHQVVLPMGAALFAVAYGGLVFAKGPLAIVVNVIIWTFGEMILFPGLVTYVMDIAPAKRRGEYMGIYTMALSLGFVIGPWAGTVVFDKFGATILWSGTFLLGAAAALIFSRVRTCN